MSELDFIKYFVIHIGIKINIKFQSLIKTYYVIKYYVIHFNI